MPDPDARSPASGPPRPPTLKDVAARAGVSYQTVSRVINGGGPVRPATDEAVRRAIAALGFEPNAAARALKSGRSRRLGVLVEDLGQFGPSGTVRGLEQAAAEAGWDLALAVVPAGDAAAVPAAASSLRRRDAGAVALVCGTDRVVGRALDHRWAVPVVGTSQAAGHLLPVVAVDQRAGVVAAVDHLHALGRRRTALIAGPADSLDGRLRLAVAEERLAQHGSTVEGAAHGDWSAAAGHAAAVRLLAGGRPDALLAANDQMALGALAAAARAGLRVPEDLAVVGFDDVPEAAWYAPALTTVRQDFVRLGARLFRVLDRAVRTGTAAVDDLVVPELVVRASAPAALDPVAVPV